MPARPDLVERSGELKHNLVEFAEDRFGGTIKRGLQRTFGRPIRADEADIIGFLDDFVLQHRLPDGRTVVEHFVEAHPELPTAEKEMLAGWSDVVEGIFEVTRREGEAVLLFNLFDELTYRTRSNMGASGLAPFAMGTFVISRILPVDDEWILSGSARTMPASSRADIHRTAREIVSTHPSLVFRNPEKLRQGWDLQRKERQIFIDFFGADLVVVAGREVEERILAFRTYQQNEVRDTDGLTTAERARREYGVVPPIPALQLPGHVRKADSVALSYDEVDGLCFLIDYTLVEDTFAQPELASDRRHRRAVLDYLEGDDIAPSVLSRLAERSPERASQVYQRILKQPTFSWEHDGEALLRRHKASYYERRPLPSITPLGVIGSSAIRDADTGRAAQIREATRSADTGTSPRKKRG